MSNRAHRHYKGGRVRSAPRARGEEEDRRTLAEASTATSSRDRSKPLQDGRTLAEAITDDLETES